MTYFLYLFLQNNFISPKQVIQVWNGVRVSKWSQNLNVWTNYSFKVTFPVVKPTMLNYEQNVGVCLSWAMFLPISKECMLWICLLRQKSQRAANRLCAWFLRCMWSDGFLLRISSNRWLSRGPLNSCGRGLEFGRGRLQQCVRSTLQHRPNRWNAHTKCTRVQSLPSDQRSASCRPHKHDMQWFPNPFPNLKSLIVHASAITPRFCWILVCYYVWHH